MTIRSSIWIFVGLTAVTISSLHIAARKIQSGSMNWESAERQAQDRGEMDLVLRLRVKRIFYAGPLLHSGLGGPSDTDDYLKAMEEVVAGREREAEIHLVRVSGSKSPVLAARASTRLEEMRYGTALPNAGKIPF